MEVDGITEKIGKSLLDSNIKTVLDLMEADEESLLEISGINASLVEQVYSSVQQFIERDDLDLDDEDNSEKLENDEEE
jgi:ERCC4-type nuclease